MKVLITGGSGLVGRAAARELLSSGHQVRILSQHADEECERWPTGVEVWQADVAQANSIDGAAEGCDAVIHAAGTVHEYPPNITFERLNVLGTVNIAEEAIRAGVARFIYISSLGADVGNSAYHESKRRAERVVKAIGPPAWVIVRPGNVYGPGDKVLSYLVQWIRTFPIIPLIGSGRQPFQPIWADDLGRALALLVERDEPRETIVNAAGPNTISMRQAVSILKTLTHRRLMMIPIPILAWKWIIRASHRFGWNLPIDEGQLQMLLENNVVSQGTNIVEELGAGGTPIRVGLARLVDSLPESLPSNKPGPLIRQRHWMKVASISSAEDSFNIVKQNFGSLLQQFIVQVDPEKTSAVRLQEGTVITLKLPMRGHIQVRVVELSPTSATAVTLEGHPLSGMITWGIRDREAGWIDLEVVSLTRASNWLDLAVMSSIGKVLQRWLWGRFLHRVAGAIGARDSFKVHHEAQTLRGIEARQAEEFMKTEVARWARQDVADRTGLPLEISG